MRKLALIALFSLPLFAGFFPSVVNTSVKSVSGQTVTMNSSFPMNGMSGIVIHNYGSEIKAITSRVIQTGKGQAKVIENNLIHHDSLPTIKTKIKKGDKIIGGYMYQNVLLLAPDADTYKRTVEKYPNKRWVHPDLYALHLSSTGETAPTKANLEDFSNRYQVGLVYSIKKGSAVLLDPISGKHVGSKGVSGLPAKGQFPFYMRFDKIEAGWFSTTETGSYYNLMKSL